MKDIINDKGFLFAVLGSVILTLLVFTNKVSADLLVGWLGGGGSLASGKFFPGNSAATSRPADQRKPE